MKKFILVLVIFTILFPTLINAGHDEEIEHTNSWLEYLALNKARYSYFKGEGYAHASFNQEVTYTQHPLYQVEEGSAGTRMVFVYMFIDEKVYVIHQEEEFYSGKNLLTGFIEKAGTNNAKKLMEQFPGRLLFQDPIEKGVSWQTDNRKVEIIDIGGKIQTVAGYFYNVVNLKRVSDAMVTYEYYAPNIGLVKRVSVFNDDYRITAELQSFKIDNKESEVY
jgi:hypothetical protein